MIDRLDYSVPVSLIPTVARLQRLKPLQHFTPNTGSVALAHRIVPVNLHGCVQKRSFPLLALDSDGAGT